MTAARTAREAMAAADRELPEVALLDLRLPDVDGWEVARWMRELAKGRDGRRLLLIAVSGCGQAGDRLRSLDAEIDLHLVKPADPAFLIAVLERFARVVGRPADGDGGG